MFMYKANSNGMFFLLLPAESEMENQENAKWVDGAIGAVKAITFICDVITYPVYLLLQRPWEKKRLSSKPKVS